ncbi:ATP synthase subunit d, mitochondrial [Eumeta japonica]|uniref:ATP synthase subunit d, mitochondrial n=1 Tax=Eumeta variegata TaxID=151549 RepID=A0A4C1TZS5_EUMVA|nr:ATP synthase subunit d, mitochondrial [Eumeta japonica]
MDLRYEKDIASTNALLPYDQMTMEDFRDAHPEMALDPINRPTFWPHDDLTEPAQPENVASSTPAPAAAH